MLVVASGRFVCNVGPYTAELGQLGGGIPEHEELGLKWLVDTRRGSYGWIFHTGLPNEEPLKEESCRNFVGGYGLGR